MTAQNTSDNQSRLASRAVRDVYPISRLVREVRVLLDGSFPLVWVEGEISNLAMPASGHVYFTLKDEAAQVRCAMFRNRNQHLRFTPENGMQVLLRVRVTMYEARGEFQLIVEHMEEAGSGAQQRAYEALKHRLGQEGLFALEHKKPLPPMPTTLGVVSSPDGAALHDILSVLRRRFPAVQVILYPVPVQGEGAAKHIAEAIALADARKECDVLIVSRGGGSLEDLWSFNDEHLARVMYQCELPIISAVGHEVDFTIADFVADVRAPTPSAAAELAVPDVRQLLVDLSVFGQRISNVLKQRVSNEQRHLQHLQRRLPKPATTIAQQSRWMLQTQRRLDFVWQRLQQQHAQKLDYLSARLKHPQAKIDLQKRQLQQLSKRLQQHAVRHGELQHRQLFSLRSRLLSRQPDKQVTMMQQRITSLHKQLQTQLLNTLQSKKTMLGQYARTLHAVSPLNTLERGYSITTDAEKRVITQSNEVSAGDTVYVRLHQGGLECEVKNVND